MSENNTPEHTIITDIADMLGIQPTQDQDLGAAVTAAVAAIRNERDDLKQKLLGMTDGKNNSERRTAVAAGRKSSQSVEDVTKSMIENTGPAL